MAQRCGPNLGRANGTDPRSGALASLSLAMLLSSLGTSIANVELPTLAQVFDASFQAVQWVVLAYLLAITTLIVGVGRSATWSAAGGCCSPASSCSRPASAGRPRAYARAADRRARGAGTWRGDDDGADHRVCRRDRAKDRTGSAMGLLGTMSAIGTALGPSLGGC